jgi:hypothetical protein
MNGPTRFNGPEDLPEGHPLAEYNGVLDDHESHIEAVSQYLAKNPDEIESFMLVVNTDEASETIPSVHEDAAFEQHVWYQLAAHISHLAETYGMPPQLAAQKATHILTDHAGGVEQ